MKQREALARLVVEEGWTIRAAAESFRVMPDTASKWVGRLLEKGVAASPDRSSRPRAPTRTTSDHIVERVKKLRLERRPMFQNAADTG